ncbi:helix-turn-helix domain-containing protein [Chroogloeocystis siderophila]|jgi:transposase-like protein|uniref:Transposase n=1 Tax=Chroogloeocystis siderophila 5.2 s.c.1 TaxID=247279 RepID=A0A1U7HW74_9CHRO|nr:helix-turn-helix domain-containing protein [Chroogloeocystis siderophila]OKH27827.1 transposase [Chroogloeocystis siderophila 5.2 s.c.1]
MTVKKLSDADKSEILKLYRETGETTSTLAERYGVSNSTISRLLKVTLPEDEYESLIALKRAARTPHSESSKAVQSTPEKLAGDIAQQLKLTQPQLELAQVEPSDAPRLRGRRTAPQQPKLVKPAVQQLQLLDAESTDDRTVTPTQLEERERPQAIAQDVEDDDTDTINAMLGEDLIDEDEDDLEDLEEDLDDDELDDLDLDDDEPFPVTRPIKGSRVAVQVLPLSEASLPKTCYLVIDRASELITRPLRDFGDLGQIPTGETQQRTLPVFDNHRVARRFSTKRDKVIKIPDSRLLQKTRSHLQAKGITRLLVDGQVYSLSTT